jgi:hypothetical protein
VKTSTWVASLASIATLAVGTLVSAPPAAAFFSDTSVALMCDEAEMTLYANVGDRVGFTFDTSCTVDPELNPFFWNANEGVSSPAGPGFFDSPSATTGTFSHHGGTNPQDWYTSESEHAAFAATLLSTSNNVPLTVGSVIGVIGWWDAILLRNIYYNIRWGGPRSASSEGGATLPETFTLTWSPGENATCSVVNTTAAKGTWIQVPLAHKCTATGTHTGGTLLGWSTSASFPVSVAREAVAQGWSAVDETFDGTRMIYIPAGGYTYVTGSNTLYPIWST